MIGLYCDETYRAMTKYVNGYDDGNNDGDKDVNKNNNAAAGSTSNGSIFDRITIPCSRLGLAEEY